MNKIISKLIATLIIGLFALTNIAAQQQQARTMYVMGHGMILYQTVVSEIDSIIFYTPEVEEVFTLRLTFGTTANAPYTPLLENNTAVVGSPVFVGIQTLDSNTWLSRLAHTLTSSNTNVATISDVGAITTLAVGTTNIRAVCNTSGAIGQLMLTVIAESGGGEPSDTRMASTMYVDRAPNFIGTFSNTALIDGTLQLTGTNTIGTYTSQEFSTINFSQIVGSWSVSHIDIPGSTVEVEFRVRTTAGTWSRWFTSSQWAFAPGTDPARAACNYTDKGNNIRGHHTGDGIARMENNRIGWLNTYNQFQYRVTLRRANATNPSPRGKAISITLLSSSLTGDTFAPPPAAREWTIVETLRQQNVPGIGGSICSPTTVTIMMQHRGITYFGGCVHPHEWVANKAVRAPNSLGANNGLFGNWVFATSVMGSWRDTDFIAYARYIYTANELAHIIYHTGPVGMSIQGNAAAGGPLVCMAGITRYSGAGHLIVIRGFEMQGGQVSAFLVNDPNNTRADHNGIGQIYRVTPANMMRVNVSRMIYVLE